jgi:voltage-gated potassium channel
VPVTTPAARAPRLQVWEDATEWPMAGLAVLFLAVFATEVLATSLSPGWQQALRIADYTIWAIFAAEFLIRLALAHARGRYLLRHLPDVAMLALPFLRTMRVLRLVPLLRALNRWVADSLRGKFVVYGGTSAVLLVFTGALAVLDAERGHPGATITTFGRALWWATVTICTVGYGDYTPITTAGRVVAVGVMIGGVMLVGAVTASFATWLVDRLRDEEEIDQAATRRDLHAVHAKLGEVERELVAIKHLLRDRSPARGDS